MNKQDDPLAPTADLWLRAVQDDPRVHTFAQRAALAVAHAVDEGGHLDAVNAGVGGTHDAGVRGTHVMEDSQEQHDAATAGWIPRSPRLQPHGHRAAVATARSRQRHPARHTRRLTRRPMTTDVHREDMIKLALATRQRAQLRKALLERDGEACRQCGDAWSGDLEVDHIVAQAHGGTDDLDNLQLLCRACNASKGSGASITGPNPNVEFERAVRQEGQELLCEVLDVLDTYVFHRDPWVRQVLAIGLMVAQEPFRERLEYLPIVAVSSTRAGSGKSTVTNLAQCLIPTSQYVTAMTNHTALIRQGAPTYVLDEAQGMELHKPLPRSWLNNAYSYTGTFVTHLATADGRQEPTAIPCFASIWLSGLRLQLADDTRTRCIWVQMEAAPKSVRIPRLSRTTREGELADLGKRLHTWAEKAAPLLPDDASSVAITDRRRRDVWHSHLRGAALLGVSVYAVTLGAILDHEEQAQELREISEVESLADDLDDLLRRAESMQGEFIPTRTLLLLLQAQYPEHWGSQAARSLTAEKLGKLLTSIGCASTQKQVDGKRSRGYSTDALRRSVDAVLPDDEVQDDDAAGETFGELSVLDAALEALAGGGGALATA